MIVRGHKMKKLFLVLSLFTMSAMYADDDNNDSSPDSKEESDIAYEGDGRGELRRRLNPGGPRRGVNPGGPARGVNPPGPGR
jgi:hypothetical protein